MEKMQNWLNLHTMPFSSLLKGLIDTHCYHAHQLSGLVTAS